MPAPVFCSALTRSHGASFPRSSCLPAYLLRESLSFRSNSEWLELQYIGTYYEYTKYTYVELSSY